MTASCCINTNNPTILARDHDDDDDDGDATSEEALPPCTQPQTKYIFRVIPSDKPSLELLTSRI